MKIGFFGNINNVAFSFAKAMWRLGHEAVIIVNKKELLHRPESRYPEYYEGYPYWIVDGSQFSDWDYLSLNHQIAPYLEILSGCDVLFLNDLGPSFLPLLQRPAISFLTGSDLTHYADFQIIDARFSHRGKTLSTMLEKRLLTDFVQRQREGLRLSIAVRFFPPGIDTHGDELLTEIGIPNSKRIFEFATDLEGINLSLPPSNERIRIYCPVRLTWKLPIEPGRSPLEYKGSDIMIRGLGSFYRKTGIKLDIILMRKGLHIAELESLIIEENIADQVTWLDEMSLVAYRKELARSDIVLEQFGESMIAGVGLDAMAAGRPVIGNLRPEILGDSMPVCHAGTPEEICAQLQRLVFDSRERERVGKAGREYVEKHANIDDFAQKCLRLLDASITQSSGMTSSLSTSYLYYLQQRLSLFEKVVLVLQEQQNEQKIKLLRTIALTDGRGLRVRKLPKRFQRQGKYGWYIALPGLESLADNAENPTRSTLLLYENDNLLQPAHSLHNDIWNSGEGCYSHWKDNLYFSTSDGSDPNTNGRQYKVMFSWEGNVTFRDFFTKVFSRSSALFRTAKE